MRKNRLTLICPICNKAFDVKRSHVTKRVTCSIKCVKILKRRRRQEEIEVQFGMPIDQLLRYLYYDKQMGIKKIARHLGVSDRNLWEWFEALGLKRRTISKAVKLQWVDNPERRITMAEKARECHLGKPGRPCPQWLKKRLSDERQSTNNPMYGRCGTLNPNWKGGKIGYRGAHWNDLKLKIRERDGFRCQHCGMPEDEHLRQYSQPLQVHHKIPYRMTEDNSDNNLVTLCLSCHRKADTKVALPLFEPSIRSS